MHLTPRIHRHPLYTHDAESPSQVRPLVPLGADISDHATSANESEWIHLVQQLVAERDEALARLAALEEREGGDGEPGALEREVQALRAQVKELRHAKHRKEADATRLRALEAERDALAADLEHLLGILAQQGGSTAAAAEPASTGTVDHLEAEVRALRAALEERDALVAELEEQILRRTHRLHELESAKP